MAETESPSSEKKDIVPDPKAAEARELAEAARCTYVRLQKEFSGVVGAEESVSEARKVIAALAPEPVPTGTLSLIAMGALGIGIYGAIGLGIAAIFSDWALHFWVQNWMWVLVGFALTGIFLVFATKFEAWLRRASEDTARKVFALVAIPAITAAIMGLIGFGSTQYFTIAAQLIFIPVTALLPAVTYFLFLATRRPSILNEFIGNMGRLGLLARRPAPADAARGREESVEERSARVESYFQRFEAIYGALRFDSGRGPVSRRDLVERLITAVENPGREFRLPQATIFIGDIFHANLIIPIGLVTILTTLGWLLVLQPDFNSQAQDVADLVPKLTPMNFAFLGAYFFGIQMLFRRFVRRDLGPNAYFAFSNRIILAVIGMWLVTAVFPVFPEHAPTSATAPASADKSPARTGAAGKDAGARRDAPADAARNAATPPADAAPAADAPQVADTMKAAVAAEKAKSEKTEKPADASAAVASAKRVASRIQGGVSSTRFEVILLLAFTIGVFPRVVWQYLSAGANKLFRVKLVLPSVEAEQPLYELDGLTVWHETRLEEEDVENVPNMASVDVVELMLHTQIPIERLVGWIDQAILLTALGTVGRGTRDKLRGLGLRTATQVVAVAKGGGNAAAALSKAVGVNELDALVLALEKEVNFDLVRAWRQV